MKGGANLDDQLVISRAVVNAVDNNEGVLDVPLLASKLQIPLECCQSYVDYYESKHEVTLVNPIEVQPVARKSTKAKAGTAEPVDGFFEG